MNERTRINKIADKEWERMQNLLKLDFPRPALTFNNNEFHQRKIQTASQTGFPLEIIGQSSQTNAVDDDNYGHGIIGYPWCLDGERNEFVMMVGPMKMAGGVPDELEPIVFQHEFGHYIAKVKDPIYAMTQTITEHIQQLNPKLIQMISPYAASTQSGRMWDTDFMDLFEESLAWIAPAQLSGVGQLQKWVDYSGKNPVFKRMPKPEEHIQWNNYKVDMGARLHLKEGHTASALLAPTSVMNYDHPHILNYPQAEEAVDRFVKNYAFLKKKFKFRTILDYSQFKE